MIPETYMTSVWLNKSTTKHNLNKILKGWIGLGKTFHMMTHDIYKTSIFLKDIQVLNALLCEV